MKKCFKQRLGVFIGAPARLELLPPRFGQEGVWTRQQETACNRRHLPRKWAHRNGERNAYAVSMHLLMRRISKGGSHSNFA